MQFEDVCADCGVRPVVEVQKFCHGCGQATQVTRIDWTFLREEIQHGLLQIDRGLLFTLKHLFVRPGHFLREYLGGRRLGHVKPLPLLLLTAAAALLLGKYLMGGALVGEGLNEEISAQLAHGDAAHSDAAGILKAKFAQAQLWANQNLTFVTLVMLPIEAAALRVAFLRSAKLNYPEWLVVTSYLTIQTFVIWSVVIVLQQWIPAARAALLPICIGVNVVTVAQMLNTQAKWKSVLRALLGFLLFQIALTVIMFCGALATTFWVLSNT